MVDFLLTAVHDLLWYILEFHQFLGVMKIHSSILMTQSKFNVF